MSANISGILFDVGGVLVALDGVPSVAKLLGVEPCHETLHEIWLTSSAVVQHETGKLAAAEFAAGVIKDLSLPTSAEAFLQDFMEWPKAVHPGAFELLDAIPSSYCIAALSNTCAVHWTKITSMGLAERFDQTYLSHEIGYLKPTHEAFQIALDGTRLAPAEVLFLDDSARNVAAARSLGMNAQLAKDVNDAWAVLERFRVVPYPVRGRRSY